MALSETLYTVAYLHLCRWAGPYYRDNGSRLSVVIMRYDENKKGSGAPFFL